MNEFDRIKKDLAWKAFKIIIVLRRTSLGLLDAELLHTPVRAEQNITDITGYFYIPDIWVKKKQYIWDDRLRDKFNNNENEKIIKIVDIIMNNGVHTKGIDYQALIAPLMSYGIRRNAKAQAHAAYYTYEMLTNGGSHTINFAEFENLIFYTNSGMSSGRYMFRRALIEFQFKWAISCGRQDRWRNLGIGHLTGEKDALIYGKRFKIENVEYYNTTCITLMRRILAYLSYFPEENRYTNGKSKSAADMFMTCTLYDLIKGVLINPCGQNHISDDNYLQFARVLIALSDMSNGDTKSAPYVVLSITDETFHKNANAAVLAVLLKKIWNAGPDKSIPEEKYNSRDFGARITDAGNSFLLDWHASFSLIASIHCFTIPPLFFLKDMLSIKYVIKTVYDASERLYKMYENEAQCFCGPNVTLHRGKYLPKCNGQLITFKQRVKELHTNHLNLYRDFIEKNYNVMGISEKDMINLTDSRSGFISLYIQKYNQWETGKGAPECF